MEVKKQIMNLKHKVKGQVSLSKLQMYVIAFVVIGVSGTVGLDVMSEVQDNMDVNKNVANEAFNATSDPYNYTVAEASDSDFKELSAVTVYDTTSQDTELTATIVDAEAGKVEVEGPTDTDDESIEYDYVDKDTTARNGADNAISGMNEILGFLPVIGLVVAAAVVIGLVSGFGRSSGRRGRA